MNLLRSFLISSWRSIHLSIPSDPFAHAMPPRKPHTKSRKGCIQCKLRHTKCGEQHPQCFTCSRLGVECTWPNSKPLHAPARSPRLEEVRTPPLITRFDNISRSLSGHNGMPEDLALDDLKLLHHFTTKTCATLDSVASQQHIWRESIVQIGFQHPFLLRGILSISALHLATLAPESNSNFVVQASNQFNRALLEFRNVLRNIGEGNCAAVFAFSCVTVIHAFAVAQIQPPINPTSDFLNCMRLVQGVVTILQPHYPILTRSELSPILENGPKGGIQGEILEILQLKSLVKSLPDEDHGETANTYVHAIDLLHGVLLEAQEAGENQSYLALLFSWPALLSPKFYASLSIQEPISLIIMAHFASILGRKRTFWWIARWNTCIVHDVESRISPDLIEWVHWPKQMCGDSEG